jgi:hypothetical protein
MLAEAAGNKSNNASDVSQHIRLMVFILGHLPFRIRDRATLPREGVQQQEYILISPVSCCQDDTFCNCCKEMRSG